MKIAITNKLFVLLFLFAVGASLCAQPVPHHFNGIQASADRTITLTLGGSVTNIINLTGTVSNQFMQMFDLYVVEASQDLAAWTPLARLLRTNNNPAALVFQDTNAMGFDQRFYRTCTNHLLTATYKPTGPFTVGMVDRVMIDPARTNPYRYTPPTNAFMVTFWYPADPPGPGVLPAPMSDTRVTADTRLYTANGFDPQWALLTPKLKGHRFEGLPVTAGANRYPVILYSHGLGGFRKLISRTVEELASHGYVVGIVDHPDCWATEFPDHRYLSGDLGGDVEGRKRDMTFLLDQLAVLNSSDPFFAGRLDLDRIGLYGGSYGGMVVQTCRGDSRVKCVLLYDATNLGSGPLPRPFLVALGQSALFYSEDWALFNSASTNAVFLQIHGADHMTPCDIGWLGQLPWGRRPACVFDNCAVWFFDTYLKGEAPPFPTDPEIYNLHRK